MTLLALSPVRVSLLAEPVRFSISRRWCRFPARRWPGCRRGEADGDRARGPRVVGGVGSRPAVQDVVVVAAVDPVVTSPAGQRVVAGVAVHHDPDGEHRAGAVRTGRADGVAAAVPVHVEALDRPRESRDDVDRGVGVEVDAGGAERDIVGATAPTMVRVSLPAPIVPLKTMSYAVDPRNGRGDVDRQRLIARTAVDRDRVGVRSGRRPAVSPSELDIRLHRSPRASSSRHSTGSGP